MGNAFDGPAGPMRSRTWAIGALVAGGLLFPFALAADAGRASIRRLRRKPRREAGGVALGRILTAGR